MREENKSISDTTLCERLVSLENIQEAVKRVMADKMKSLEVSGLPAYMQEHWPGIRERIVARNYKPKPMLHVAVPKDDAGVVLSGLHAAMDRVIQLALVQVLIPVFEPTFSDFSFGFRPNRSAEEAVKLAQVYISAGYRHVVEIDLSKFIGAVDLDILMCLVDKHLFDKSIRRLIFEYVKSGVISEANMMETASGIPPEESLSGLLLNIYLTPYDRELEHRELRFVRYAGNCSIFTKSRMSSYRVRDNAKSFLERKLKLIEGPF